MTMFEPKLGPISRAAGVAGQIAFTVTVTYPDLEAMYPDVEHTPRPTIFVGSAHGAPGPVVMFVTPTWQEHVIDPARFGETFDEEWIRRFFTTPVDVARTRPA